MTFPYVGISRGDGQIVQRAFNSQPDPPPQRLWAKKSPAETRFKARFCRAFRPPAYDPLDNITNCRGEVKIFFTRQGSHSFSADYADGSVVGRPGLEPGLRS